MLEVPFIHSSSILWLKFATPRICGDLPELVSQRNVDRSQREIPKIPKNQRVLKLSWSKHLQTLWMQDPLKNSETYLLASEFDLQLWNCWPTQNLTGIPFSKSISTYILFWCDFYYSIAWKIYWLKTVRGCGGSQDVLEKVPQWQQNLLLLVFFPCNVHWEVLLHVL